MFGWVLVTMLWKPLLILAVLAGVGWGLWKLTLRIDRKHLERVRQLQALEARAEYEHWRLMNGDTRTGVYGQYPPAV